MAYIDISQEISPASPVYPGDVPLRLTLCAQDPARVSALSMSAHLGTHVDATSHVGGEQDVADIAIETLCGHAQVIDVTGVKAITPELVQGVTCERVLLKTGFEMPDQWCSDFPIILPQAMQALIAQGVKVVGIDTPSVDPEGVELPSHHVAFDAGVVLLENLVLAHVEAATYRLIALPLAIRGLEASPVRAILETLDA